MKSTFATAAFHAQREDILALLPVSTVVEYRKGQIIYGPGQPSTSLYLLVTGNVRLSHITDDGYELVLEIIRLDEIFGESGFLNVVHVSERATAHGDVRLMIWAVSAIEDLMTKNPRLAVSLLQLLVQRVADFACRIESLAIDNTERRLARALIRFSERLGTSGESGSIRIMPLSHELLARHIGTSREVVTNHMNQFRRQGYLDYSRSGIVLHGKTLAAWITGRPPLSESSYVDRTSALSTTTAL